PTRTSKSFCDWLKRWASDSTSAVRLGSGTLNWNRTGWAPHARRGPTRGSSHHARSAAATTPDATSVLRSCRRERTQRSSIVCLLSNGGVAVTWSREECQDRWLAYYLRVIAETTLGALAALGSALTWAVTSLLARSLQPGLGSVVVNAARSTVGGALLLGWVAATVGVGAFAAASTSALALLALSIVAAIVLWATPWARVGASGLGRTGGAALVRLVALGVLTALSSVMFVASVKYAGVAVSTVLSSTAPMFAIPLARVFFGERLSRTALLGASVTIAGIVVLQL